MLEDRLEGFTTTFAMDFTIADRFGTSAVKDTFNRAFNEWKDNYLYLTDLVVVLNHKIWEHYNNGRMGLARLYDSLWGGAEACAYDTLKGEELAYFWRVCD